MSLTVQNVSKTYGSFRAVDCLNFDFGQSGVFALLGTNGAGKTTSIRIILGMLSKDSGTVEWKGEPIRPAQGGIGYLAEDRGLYPKIDIINQMYFFASIKGLKKSRAKKRNRLLV